MSEDARCLVIDSHPTVRLGVRGLLSESFDIEEAGDGAEALDLIATLGEFDIAIVELATGSPTGGPTGLKAIRGLRRGKPALGIVAHAPWPAPYCADAAFEAGATAFVAKSSSPETLRAAVAAVTRGERFLDPAVTNRNRSNGTHGLTRRQRETLQSYADGRSTAEVAERLGVTTETVRTHTKALLSRLKARDRAHAVAIALRSSLIE